MNRMFFWLGISIFLHGVVFFFPFPSPQKSSSLHPTQVVYVSSELTRPAPMVSPPHTVRNSFSSFIKPLPQVNPVLTDFSSPSLKPFPQSFEPSLPEPQIKCIPVFSEINFSQFRRGGNPEKVDEYFRRIKEKIEKAKFYPSLSLKKKEEGKVIYEVWIGKDGTVEKIKMVKSSGYSLLDKGGEEIIRNASPFPPPPGGKGIKIRIPIKFSIQNG
ncbi:MAG TPA: energy transducer TonB [bacterium]|nr:energy transducer TonB [bacterium]HEX68425.1 energy transducer TonB [bacterium]